MLLSIIRCNIPKFILVGVKNSEILAVLLSNINQQYLSIHSLYIVLTIVRFTIIFLYY